jgi:hypothetical protein
MTEEKELGRKRTQFLDDLKNRRIRILGVKGESRRWKMETIVYQSNSSVRKK